MQIKSFLWSISFLAVSGVFAFCAKENPSVEPAPVTSVDGSVADRGICQVTIMANGASVNVCGTQTNATVCGVGPNNIDLFGSETIGNGSSATYNLATPTTLIVTRNPVGPQSLSASVTVLTPSSRVTYALPLGGAGVQVGINGSCSQ